ncbi:hypothetical protein FALBO_8612 [Fusarium albosuccineum]|uniref:Uncharacterized protein n=1 Tax=Fusarium albosuccineum TaxID=1237068 RepID=A0A8H4LB84_9HYPO|nr:hypothetical protein FALBO_8612 [Fusarium albosuccineum]
MLLTQQESDVLNHYAQEVRQGPEKFGPSPYANIMVCCTRGVNAADIIRRFLSPDSELTHDDADVFDKGPRSKRFKVHEAYLDLELERMSIEDRYHDPTTMIANLADAFILLYDDTDRLSFEALYNFNDMMSRFPVQSLSESSRGGRKALILNKTGALIKWIWRRLLGKARHGSSEQQSASSVSQPDELAIDTTEMDPGPIPKLVVANHSPTGPSLVSREEGEQFARQLSAPFYMISASIPAWGDSQFLEQLLLPRLMYRRACGKEKAKPIGNILRPSFSTWTRVDPSDWGHLEAGTKGSQVRSMMAPRLAAVAAAFVPLLTLVPQPVEAWLWPFGGYARPSGAVGIAANGSTWLDAVAKSNASGSVSFKGYDVSKPWPGKPMDGWTISATGVDLSKGPDFSHGYLPQAYYQPTIGDDVRVIAPESLYTTKSNLSERGRPVVEVHSSWVFCAWLWFLPSYGNASTANNPKNLEAKADGSCSPWLSDDCIKALEKQASTSYSLNYEPRGVYGSRHRCGDIDIPEECSVPYLDDGQPLLDDWGIPLAYLNGSTTWQDGYNLDDNQTVEDQHDMWKTITESYRPVLTMFGHYNEDPDAEVDPGFAKLSCVKASNGSAAYSSGSNAGSDAGNDDKAEEDAAATLHTASPAIIAFLLLLIGWLI